MSAEERGKVSSEQEKQKVSEESKPVLEGMFVAAIFWLWGALFLFAPVYLGIFGGWRTVLHVLGGIVLTISLIGAVVELNELWRNKGVTYWSVALVFFIPAIFLQLGVMFGTFSFLWEKVAKIAVLILVFIGGPFLVMGLSYFLSRPAEKQKQESFKASPDEMAKRKTNKRKADLSLIITLLALATAVIKLVSEFAK